MARRFVREENFHNVDLTGVYAYADSSHARDRELWRGFLGCILPVILPNHTDIIDEMISNSLVDSIEDLVIKRDFLTQERHAIHIISTHIAKAIGVPPEFALASFYNCEYGGKMPTKLYKFHYKPVKKKTLLLQEDNLIGKWLVNFEKMRTDKQFLDFIEIWKGQLD